MTKKLHKRYEYWKESDTAYDTKIKYGQYFRIIDKKECVNLLNDKDVKIKIQEKEIYNLKQKIEKLMQKIEKLDNTIQKIHQKSDKNE